MKVILLLLLKWEGSHFTKAQNCPCRQNHFEHPYSLHKHWYEQLLNNLYQLLSPLWFPEYKYTSTNANSAAISSYPVFCLFECLLSAFLNAWVQYQKTGGLKIWERGWKSVGERVASKSPRRRRGNFYDNIKCWEMPFRSNFLPLWMLFFCFFEYLLVILRGYNNKEWILTPHVISSIL